MEKNKVNFIIENDFDVNNIKNIVHIGDIVVKPTNIKGKGKWCVFYVCDKNNKTKENGRIYLIVVYEKDENGKIYNNGKILKIGSSECKGGIKNTFNFYQGGLVGSPSIRTFGVHKLIQEQLDLGNTIKIFALFIEPIKVVIDGLFSSIEKITYPQIKEMEDLCREDYKKIYGKYPIWNFQENAEEWPEYIKIGYKEQVNNRGTNIQAI